MGLRVAVRTHLCAHMQLAQPLPIQTNFKSVVMERELIHIISLKRSYSLIHEAKWRYPYPMGN